MENSFGEKLYFLRSKKGITQQELAIYVGVSVKTISAWETDQLIPEPNYILSIANYFGVKPNLLINGMYYITKSNNNYYLILTLVTFLILFSILGGFISRILFFCDYQNRIDLFKIINIVLSCVSLIACMISGYGIFKYKIHKRATFIVLISISFLILCECLVSVFVH